MKRDDEIAIAEFLRLGGGIVKVVPELRATAQEVLDYLASRGVSAKYFPRDPKPFLCQKRRLSLRALFELANKHRRDCHLQRFVLRD